MQFFKEVDAVKSFSFPEENQKVALFDLTHAALLNGFNITKMMHLLKSLESLALEMNLHLFLSLRHDLLSNEYLFYIPRVLAIQPDSSTTSSEEQFSRNSKIYSVLFMYKASSSKLEVEDRLQFSLSSGFSFKTISNSIKTATHIPHMTELNDSSEAMILVEDSDRDSEGEMDADADF